ncbi:TPA: agmatinase [Candidatus Gastranaerophilales bacterium HUM_13]|nr:agmatinase [Fusobacterium sp. CAG:439]DAB10193.1 MAG TPA: agmatinase [Candidatus Gastranaerophilales bacterium HUM_13]DAB10403.1 MAG TPA: agmatinase [Candidatus Gastranaerophilales bacterium HUM_15]DAB16186.1 MAG TPA: agmatinase [Candidatus Gastranaerophilales bacterium HUM_19]DAB16981.1 MAG TPA: agmatinase [Candidatus Gastranaerophilales bacterium HUM_17]DAB26974.1 MAG TPA: agmatinase [Candidatus Gastranaerophilales bacterium HUM_23]
MLTGPFLDRNWMGQNPDYASSDIIMLGMPFDGTVSYRPGSRFAPEQIRLASWGLEEYSPYFDKHLEDCNFHDAGDLEFPLGNTKKSLGVIRQNVEEIYKDGKRVFGIGGEHLVTLPEIQAISKYVDNLAIVHFDAHTDLREEYLGEPLSHSAVIRHSAEIIGFENLKQIGIRSGMKEEFELMKKYNTLIHEHKELDVFKDKNIFITVDLDVLDTSIMPGTGTPEVGGLDFNQLVGWFKYLSQFNIIGADVVELAPDYDASGASTAVATKVIRELLMAVS